FRRGHTVLVILESVPPNATAISDVIDPDAGNVGEASEIDVIGSVTLRVADHLNGGVERAIGINVDQRYDTHVIYAHPVEVQVLYGRREGKDRLFCAIDRAVGGTAAQEVRGRAHVRRLSGHVIDVACR